MAKKDYVYFLTDKGLIVSKLFNFSMIPVHTNRIKDLYGKEYLVKRIIPSSETDSTTHVLLNSVED